MRRHKRLQIVESAIERATESTRMCYVDEQIEHEPAITDWLLNNIQREINQIPRSSITWKAKVLTDRGPNSQEKKYGADFLGTLRVRTRGYNVDKGFIAQAKRLDNGTTFSDSEFRELKSQCERMLSLTPASFVFVYSHRSFRVIPAIAIVASTDRNYLSYYFRSIPHFFAVHITSFVGDRRISSPHIRSIESLLEDFNARAGMQLLAFDDFQDDVT